MSFVATQNGNNLQLPKGAQQAAFLLMPSLEGRRAFLNGGVFSFENTAYNRRMCGNFDIEVKLVENKDEMFDVGPTLKRPNFDPPTFFLDPSTGHQKPIINYDHQKEVHNFFCDLLFEGAYVAGIFAEMGTGKTKMAIDLINYHFCKGRIDAVIVLAKKGVHAQWSYPKEEDGEVVKLAPIDMFTQKNIETERFVWGNRVAERRMKPSMLRRSDTALKWACFPFEAYTSPVGRKLIEDFVSAHEGRIAFIGDETHKLKNPTAKRTEFAVEQSKRCNVRLAMTGTPIAKNLVDEYSQMALLSEDILGHKYVTTFKNEFCQMGGYQNKVIIGQKNLELFKSITSPYIYRITKAECLDLPEKQYEVETFHMSLDQIDAYRSIQKTATYTDPKTGVLIEYEAVVSQLNALQQVSNGFLKVPNSNDVIEFKNPRLDTLLNLTDGVEEKFVVWAKYHYDVETLKKALGDTAALYYGKLSDTQREEQKQQFIQDRDTQYLILTAATGAEGLDGLQEVASTAIYYSNTYNSIERWQSEDRIHRIGMGGKALYIDLVGIGSTDRPLLRNLKKKKALADLVLDVGREMGLDSKKLF